MSEKAGSGTQERTFEAQIPEVLQELRAALSRMLGSLPGSAGASRAVDLAKLLRLETNLAWKLSRILSAEDPWSAARYIPGANGMSIVVDAARSVGAAEEALLEVEAAYVRFRELRDRHAGDRATLEMMAAAMSTRERSKQEQLYRRRAYEAGGYIWGVQSRAQLCTTILFPSKDQVHLDCAILRGFVDLRRLRPDVAWRIGLIHSVDAAGEAVSASRREPLIPDTEARHGPLIPEFSSGELVENLHVTGEGANREYVLDRGPVGNAGVVSGFLGEVLRQATPCHPIGDDDQLHLLHSSRTPTQSLIFDVLVDRDLGFEEAPTPILWGDLFALGPGAERRDCDRLPFTEQIERLGPGSLLGSLAEVPRYVELIDWACDRLAIRRADCEVFRFKLPYPPVPASVALRFRLPARGSAD